MTPPFKLDLRTLVADARRKISTRVGGITISLPFLSFDIEPQDIERKVAAEVLIRLADRRVLNSYECCDDCIDRALASLQEIRSLLVSKQVDLALAADGPLFLLISAMLEGIRQFLTFEQRLSDPHPQDWPGREHYEPRGLYFAGLEMLRAHLLRCLIQVAKIANLELPKESLATRYPEPWELEAYVAIDQTGEGV